ncbi:hypothetical protein GCM10009872_55700 [Actinopolymorpha rutila]
MPSPGADLTTLSSGGGQVGTAVGDAGTRSAGIVLLGAEVGAEAGPEVGAGVHADSRSPPATSPPASAVGRVGRRALDILRASPNPLVFTPE